MSAASLTDVVLGGLVREGRELSLDPAALATVAATLRGVAPGELRSRVEVLVHVARVLDERGLGLAAGKLLGVVGAAIARDGGALPRPTGPRRAPVVGAAAPAGAQPAARAIAIARSTHLR